MASGLFTKGGERLLSLSTTKFKHKRMLKICCNKYSPPEVLGGAVSKVGTFFLFLKSLFLSLARSLLLERLRGDLDRLLDLRDLFLSRSEICN
jgi:hypothetical protein